MVLSHPDRLSGIARARTAPSLDRDESPDRPGRALSARPPRRGEPPFGGRSVVALHCSVRAVPRRPLAVPALETHLRRRNLAVGPGGPDLAAQRPTMISRRFDMSILATRVRALGRTCVFLSALCAAAAIAQAPVQPPASPKPAEAAGPAGPAAAAIAAQGPQPPDGVWLKDPDGREYFVDSLAKSAGVYRRVEDKTIRTVWGVTLHLEREDEQSFYFRVYRQTEADTPVMIKQQEPSADQLDAAAKTYQQAVESRLWQVSPFGAGLPASGQWRHGFAVADMNGD